MSSPVRRCHAGRCEVRVGPHMLLCRSHWAQLTDRLRESIAQNYNPTSTVQSPAYRLDASRAVLYLSQLQRWRQTQRKKLGISGGRALGA